MNIYRLSARWNEFATVVHKDDVVDCDISFNQPLDGRKYGTSWRPFEVEILQEEDEPPKPLPDVFCFGGTIVALNSRACDGLAEILTPNCELLPLKCGDGVLFAINTTLVLNALDRAKSDLSYIDLAKTRATVKRYWFNSNSIAPEAALFKIPETARVETFATDVVVDRVATVGLLGFDFVRVWGSNDPLPKKRFLP